jgi:hypothetical protein
VEVQVVQHQQTVLVEEEQVVLEKVNSLLTLIQQVH